MSIEEFRGKLKTKGFIYIKKEKKRKSGGNQQLHSRKFK